MTNVHFMSSDILKRIGVYSIGVLGLCASGWALTSAAIGQEMGTRVVLEQTWVLSEKGSTRGTGYIESNKIVTLDDRMHVTWLDAGVGGPEPVRIQTLDLTTGEWSPVYTVGEAITNHGDPTLLHDSRGYLHLVFDGHHGPVRYRRSVRPNDASEWTEPETIISQGTYTSLVCDADDTLHLVCRDNVAENWQVIYFRRESGGTWSEGRPLVKPTVMDGRYRVYRASLYLDEQQRLHLGFVLYPGRAFQDALEKGLGGYMRSDDGGETWKRSDGTVVPTPTDTEFERIPITQNSVRASNLVVDSDGMPYLAFVSTGFHSFRDRWGEAVLWKRDADGWRSIPLNPFIEQAHPEHRASWAEPALTFDHEGRLYIALVAVDVNKVDPRSAWINEPESIYGNVSSRIVVLVSEDRGETFAMLPMTAWGSETLSWLPSFERETGHNRVTFPGLMYTRGMPGTGATPEDAVSEIVFYRFKSADR